MKDPIDKAIAALELNCGEGSCYCRGHEDGYTEEYKCPPCFAREALQSLRAVKDGYVMVGRVVMEKWADYMNDMRPETRNDFLRAFQAAQKESK